MDGEATGIDIRQFFGGSPMRTRRAREQQPPPAYSERPQPMRLRTTFDRPVPNKGSFGKFLNSICAVVLRKIEGRLSYTVYHSYDDFKAFCKDCPNMPKPVNTKKKYYVYLADSPYYIIRSYTKKHLLKKLDNVKMHWYDNIIESFLCCYYYTQFSQDEDANISN